MPASSPPRRSEYALLFVLLLAGAALRVTGLFYAPGQVMARPDEELVVGKAFGFYLGDFNPRFFNYPSFWLYLCHFGYRTLEMCGRLFGEYSSHNNFLAAMTIDNSPLYLVGRTLSLLFSLASIVVFFRWVRLVLGPLPALMSAGFLSVSCLPVRLATFSLTDTPALFFVLLALPSIHHIHTRGMTHDYVMAGIAAGLAASTKYIGVFLWPAILLAAYLSHNLAGHPTGLITRWRRPGLLWALAAFCTAFLLTTPWSVLDFSTFVRDLRGQSTFIESGFASRTPVGWIHHARFTLPGAIGWPLLLVALIGFVVDCVRRPHTTWIWVSFPLIYYVYGGRGHAVFVRYMLPMVPFLIFWAAAGVTWIVDYLPPKKRHLFATVCAALLATPTLLDALWYSRLVLQDDTRVQAAEWIGAHVSSDTMIGQCAGPYLHVTLAPTTHSVLSSIAAWIPPAEFHAARSRLAEIEQYRGHQGYVSAIYDPEAARFLIDGNPVAAQPSVLVVVRSHHQNSYLELDPPTLSQGAYHLAASFLPGTSPAPPHLYDPQDAFSIPYLRHNATKRPGPHIDIYVRTE